MNTKFKGQKKSNFIFSSNHRQLEDAAVLILWVAQYIRQHTVRKNTHKGKRPWKAVDEASLVPACPVSTRLG